jgi:hypothetical protein
MELWRRPQSTRDPGAEVHFMSELAFNQKGHAFDVGGEAAHWGVHEVASHGHLAVTLDDDGSPLTVPITTNRPELSARVPRRAGPTKYQYAEGHDPGLTYDRNAVDAAVVITAADRAHEMESQLIRHLHPRDNLLGQGDDHVPF